MAEFMGADKTKRLPRKISVQYDEPVAPHYGVHTLHVGKIVAVLNLYAQTTSNLERVAALKSACQSFGSFVYIIVHAMPPCYQQYVYRYF
jgi:hypothetical protein